MSSIKNFILNNKAPKTIADFIAPVLNAITQMEAHVEAQTARVATLDMAINSLQVEKRTVNEDADKCRAFIKNVEKLFI